jgi:hypothetical protein
MVVEKDGTVDDEDKDEDGVERYEDDSEDVVADKKDGGAVYVSCADDDKRSRCC